MNADLRPISMVTPIRLLWIQGAYYLITGLWPLLSIDSFLAVTGPKTDHLQAVDPTSADHWLVMTAGVLITAAGLSLLAAAWRSSASLEAITLAIAVAVGLTGIDIVYVSRRVIDPIYLADALVEVLLLMGWLLVLTKPTLQQPNSYSTTPLQAGTEVPVASQV